MICVNVRVLDLHSFLLIASTDAVFSDFSHYKLNGPTHSSKINFALTNRCISTAQFLEINCQLLNGNCGNLLLSHYTHSQKNIYKSLENATTRLIMEVEATIKNYRVLLLNFAPTRKTLYELFTNWLLTYKTFYFLRFGFLSRLALAQQQMFKVDIFLFSLLMLTGV